MRLPETCFDHFVDENGILHEMIPQEGGFDEKTLLGRYINPGHTIEDCWFMHTEWALAGDAAHMKKTAALLSKTPFSRMGRGIRRHSPVC